MLINLGHEHQQPHPLITPQLETKLKFSFFLPLEHYSIRKVSLILDLIVRNSDISWYIKAFPLREMDDILIKPQTPDLSNCQWAWL